jgi:hypothetical protein
MENNVTAALPTAGRCVMCPGVLIVSKMITLRIMEQPLDFH